MGGSLWTGRTLLFRRFLFWEGVIMEKGKDYWMNEEDKAWDKNPIRPAIEIYRKIEELMEYGLLAILGWLVAPFFF
jgi:hypothetical protein